MAAQQTEYNWVRQLLAVLQTCSKYSLHKYKVPTSQVPVPVPVSEVQVQVHSRSRFLEITKFSFLLPNSTNVGLHVQWEAMTANFTNKNDMSKIQSQPHKPQPTAVFRHRWTRNFQQQQKYTWRRGVLDLYVQVQYKRQYPNYLIRYSSSTTITSIKY